MDRRERLDRFQARAQSMKTLSAMVIEAVPGSLPEIQQLRMKLSQSRALILAIELALMSLYERELPRAERTVDPNAHLNHQEARMLVSGALQLIQKAKDSL